MLDLKKLGYKYPQADIGEFVTLLKNGFYRNAAADRHAPAARARAAADAAQFCNQFLEETANIARQSAGSFSPICMTGREKKIFLPAFRSC